MANSHDNTAYSLAGIRPLQNVLPKLVRPIGPGVSAGNYFAAVSFGFALEIAQGLEARLVHKTRINPGRTSSA